MRALSPLRQLRQGLELRAIDDEDGLVFATDIEGLEVRVAFDRDRAGRVDRVMVGPPANVTLHRRDLLRSSRVRMRLAAGVGLAAAAQLRRRRRPRRAA